MELEVTDHPENARFEIRADGELVGFLDYRLRDGEIGLLHTETDTRLRRRGIGGRLVQSSLDSARERHLAVLPNCLFVRRWIAGHPEYADLVPEGRRQQFGLLPRATAASRLLPRHGCIAATSATAASRLLPRHGCIAVPMSFTERLRFTLGNRHRAGRVAA